MRSKTDFYRLFFEQLARRGFDVKRPQSSDYIADIYFKNQLVAYFSKADTVIQNPFVTVKDKLIRLINDTAQDTANKAGICRDCPYTDANEKLPNGSYKLAEYNTPISDMTNKLTVAAGRGMRYALFVQGFDQLKEKYSDNIANTIKGNCQVWAYLQSDDPETLREMSDKLGSYTTSSYQLSASNGKYTTPSNSQSVSLTERKLLNTDEVRRVKRPHQIITSRDHPAMMYAPDLSQWMFNKMLGLGDMEHNRRLREEREQKRPIITDTKQEIALWNIWIYYQKDIMRRLSQQKGAMGGGSDDE